MTVSEWPQLPGQGPGPGPGDTDTAAEGVHQVPKSYSGIAAINKSVRDNKNVLEVRLEKSENARFNLSNVETEGLLRKLGIDSTHFIGVSACPEGKGVVYITLHPSVNINRFIHKNEAYVLKEGVQTSYIRPAGKKEVSVLVTGLHPNTKDQAVMRYLAAHGKVSQSDQVIHHVYPGKAGSSLLAGKLNGNRSYMVEVTKHMGSFHIIDGEKVSIRYRGQIRSCARCHRPETQCPGKGVARECSSERILLSTHMQDHWKDIGYKPDNSDLNEVDEGLDVRDISVQIGSKNNSMEGPDLTMRYNSLIINGFLPGTDLHMVHDVLLAHGLPPDKAVTDLLRKEKAGKVTIENLASSTCVELMDRLHGKVFLKRKIFVTAVVAASPMKPSEIKQPLPDLHTDTNIQVDNQHSPALNSSVKDPPSAPTAGPSSSPPGPPARPPSPSPIACSSPPPSFLVDSVHSNTTKGPGVKQKIDIFDEKTDKRKAEKSPELTKKDKKKLRSAEKALKKQESRLV